jgi:hypothetical protein
MDEDFIVYEIEEFGLTTRECELILTATNGLLRTTGTDPSSELLVANIIAEVGNIATDQERYRRSLTGYKGETAELAYEMHDLAEKLTKLEQWQVAAVEFFAWGYWNRSRSESR